LPKPAHRPEHVPTDKTKLLVKVMIAGGIEQSNVARSLGISRPTLRKHYPDEIKSGGAQANGNVVAALYKNATGGNVVAQIWWTKTRMGWKEQTIVENVGKDGRPIEQVVTYRWAEPVKER
jgi:hypothetical protein